ncbi:MAG: glycosyltransferase family 2 protein [Clostridiales bacterium]|nr:glycosyltransferase family 2 protein [Clostridiales bacterium]
MNGISIVIPIYNVEKYLRKCLDSVCAQSDCVQEIILVNDGSKDNSLQICREYAAKDDRIKIIDQENKGASAAACVGAGAAQCDYIGFVDSDDYVDKDMYQKLYDKIIDANADVVFCGFVLEDEDGNVLSVRGHAKNTNSTVFDRNDGRFNLKILPTLNDGKIISGSRCNKLFKRDILINNLAFRETDIRVGEDLALTASVIFSANRIACLHDNLYHYVQWPTSVVHSYKSKNLQDWEHVVGMLADSINAYNYKIDDFDNCSLALLYSICLEKIRTVKPPRKTRREEYKKIGENKKARELLKSVKYDTTFKHKIVFTLLKLRLYGLLSCIY